MLVYAEEYDEKQQAQQREYEIKQLTKQQKEMLIENRFLQ
jgi:predicted GIY-YIG superfamily endonuclease